MSGGNRTWPVGTLLERPQWAAELDRFAFVTPRIREDLERYVQVLAEWQRAHNLVSRSTLNAVWTRHIADSLQLLDHAPPFREWVDLGSGAGFPGLVIAIAVKENRTNRVTLVESNRKKAAFLRAAIRATAADAVVAPERIEEHATKMAGQADVVSARALAPLAVLCGLASPYLKADSVLLLLKGRGFEREHEEAAKTWRYDLLTVPSATDPDGKVVAIRNLKPRGQ